jgi:hypothetical protein
MIRGGEMGSFFQLAHRDCLPRDVPTQTVISPSISFNDASPDCSLGDNPYNGLLPSIAELLTTHNCSSLMEVRVPFLEADNTIAKAVVLLLLYRS